MSDQPRPALGLATAVTHPLFGAGKIVAYEGENYVVLFKGEAKRVAFTFEAMKAAGPAGDAETDRVRQAVREALGDLGWLEVDAELGKRWTGGKVVLVPGKADTQGKEISIEEFFKKITGIRDKLRVLEQKLNAHPVLTPEEKLDLQGYITRSYGSLTTFNLLFAAKESQFQGQQGKEG